MERKKILIVDDEQTTQRLLENILQKEGHEILRAANGKEGLEILKLGNVDLIILDILMPVMDGFTFYKEIKMDEITQHIPVLVLTVRKRMEDAFMALGAQAFVGKPFESEKLLNEIKMILRREDGLEEEIVDTETAIENTKPQQVASSTLTTSSNEGDTANVKLQKFDPKNILVAGTSEGIVTFMSDQLKLQGCNVQVAMTGQTVISKALQFKPDIVLLEVNMDSISANEIIDVLKKDETVHTQILLYSYFVTPEREKSSIENAYYTNHFEHDPHADKTENHPVYYLGAFHKNSFVHRIKKFLSYSF